MAQLRASHRIVGTLALLGGLWLATVSAGAAEIRDKAGMFSESAIRKAETTLERIEREYQTPTLIETTPSLKGESIDKASLRGARAWGKKGVYVLISKGDKTLEARDYQSFLGPDRNRRIVRAFSGGFEDKGFDAGLEQGAAEIAAQVSAVGPPTQKSARGLPGPRGPAVPARRHEPGGSGMGILLTLGLVVLGVILLSRLFGRAGRPQHGPGMPGPGQPGYGMGGGGGFWSGLFGGLGGAMAGNWLYDQMSGRHGHHGTDMSPGQPHDGSASPDQPTGQDDWGGASADWGDSGGGGGDWGGGGDGGW